MSPRKLGLKSDSTALRRVEQALTLMYAGRMVWRAANERYEKYQSATSYTITINGDDDIYGELQKWLLESLPSSRQRSLMLYSLNARGSQPGECAPDGYGPRVKPGDDSRMELHYDGSRSQTVHLEGHPIQLMVVTPEMKNVQEIYSTRRNQRVVMSARSEPGRDAIVRLCESLVDRKRQEALQPRIYTPGSWGAEWVNKQDLGRRTIDSVILKEGQTERLILDLQEFLDSEDRYVKFSLPWHRGYMFHGPPGTGKTSIAKALANHFGLDLYWMSPSEMKKDSNLTAMIGNITPKSILLLEDLDAFHSATSREDNNGVTMSGLLNALDGVATPHGLITIMTTNNLEALDPALTRPGRVDLSEEISPADAYQIAKLYKFFYDRPLLSQVPPGVLLSPAQIVEAFKRNMDDHQSGLAALESLTKMPIGTP